MSQNDLAKALGTTQQQVSRWLESNTPPKPSGYLLRLARALGVTTDYLLDPEMEEPDSPGLTDDEEMILRLSRILGVDEAIGRLMAVSTGVAGVTSSNPEAPRRSPDRQSRGGGIKRQSG